MTKRSLGWLLSVALFSGACNLVLQIDEAKPESSAGGATGSGGSGTGTPCEKYCDTIGANCKGDNAEYASHAVCMSMCVEFEPGVDGVESGDNLACRTYHAGAAAGDPALHCRHAGPLGGGICGDDPCAPFCLLVQARCGSQDMPPYASELDCRNVCQMAKYPYLTGASDTDLGLMAGDTFNCRLYHLEAAYDDESAMSIITHCPHTGKVSAPCQLGGEHAAHFPWETSPTQSAMSRPAMLSDGGIIGSSS